MPNKITEQKRNTLATEILNSLNSKDVNVRTAAFNKGMKLIAQIQRSIDHSITPFQQVQAPFIMVALWQTIDWMAKEQGWAIELVNKIKTLIESAKGGVDNETPQQ